MRFRSNRMLAVVAIIAAFLINGLPFGARAGASDSGQQPKPQPQSPKEAPPRNQEPHDPDDSPIRLGTELVVLDVTVVDSANKPIMDLNQDQFQVFEDKIPQKVEF